MSMLGVGLDFSRMPVDPVSSAMVSSAVVPTSHYDANQVAVNNAAKQAEQVSCNTYYDVIVLLKLKLD